MRKEQCQVGRIEAEEAKSSVEGCAERGRGRGFTSASGCPKAGLCCVCACGGASYRPRGWPEKDNTAILCTAGQLSLCSAASSCRAVSASPPGAGTLFRPESAFLLLSAEARALRSRQELDRACRNSQTSGGSRAVGRGAMDGGVVNNQPGVFLAVESSNNTRGVLQMNFAKSAPTGAVRLFVCG